MKTGLNQRYDTELSQNWKRRGTGEASPCVYTVEQRVLVWDDGPPGCSGISQGTYLT